MANIQNFFEWGIECVQLETDSAQVPGVSPISKVSFSRKMVRSQSDSQIAGYTNIVAGTGDYNFEMLHSNGKIRDAFNLQTKLDSVSFIRYSNTNGQMSEEEKYTADNVVITEYSFESGSSDGSAQAYRVGVSSRGKEVHRKLVRDADGNPAGYVVSNGNSGR